MYIIYRNGMRIGTIANAGFEFGKANYEQKQLEIRTTAGELVGMFVPAKRLLGAESAGKNTDDYDRQNAMTWEQIKIKLGIDEEPEAGA